MSKMQLKDSHTKKVDGFWVAEDDIVKTQAHVSTGEGNWGLRDGANRA